MNRKNSLVNWILAPVMFLFLLPGTDAGVQNAVIEVDMKPVGLPGDGVVIYRITAIRRLLEDGSKPETEAVLIRCGQEGRRALAFVGEHVLMSWAVDRKGKDRFMKMGGRIEEAHLAFPKAGWPRVCWSSERSGVEWASMRGVFVIDAQPQASWPSRAERKGQDAPPPGEVRAKLWAEDVEASSGSAEVAAATVKR